MSGSPVTGPSLGLGGSDDGGGAWDRGRGTGLEAEILVRRSRDFTLDLSLAIEPGTTVALLGPNGAGKSTAVEVLAGLAPLDGGRVRLGSRTLDDPAGGCFVHPEHRRIGVVFQDYLLFDHLSVIDNVAFGPSTRGRGGRPRLRRHRGEDEARAWLERLGLADLADRRPGGLSGGQRQRVAVARALAAEPDMILLDEPLAALDIATRTRLRRLLIDHLSDFEGPRLLITHEPSDAFTLADRVLIVEHGRTTQSGSVEEIRRHPATPYVAALTGTNFLTGVNHRGTIAIDGVDSVLRTADSTTGPVQVTIPPRAISLHRRRPDGSPRNIWTTVIEWIEPLGDTTRIQLGGPLPLLADITPSAAEALGLAPGDAIWAVVKATEVTTRATEVTTRATGDTGTAIGDIATPNGHTGVPVAPE